MIWAMRSTKGRIVVHSLLADDRWEELRSEKRNHDQKANLGALVKVVVSLVIASLLKFDAQ